MNGRWGRKGGGKKERGGGKLGKINEVEENIVIIRKKTGTCV